VIAVVVLIADARGTLEPTIKAWEKKLGIPVPEEIVKEIEKVIYDTFSLIND
jgi:hypothetical protein